MLTCWSVMTNLSRFGIRQFWPALARPPSPPRLPIQPRYSWDSASSGAAFFCSPTCIQRLTELSPGTLHGFTHVLATFFIGWFATYASVRWMGSLATSTGLRWLDFRFKSPFQLLLAGAIIFVLGWIVGSIVMGIYLLSR